jgi:hypothetical protein
MEFILQEYHRNTPDDDLINDVQRVAEIYNKNSLTGKEYSKYGKYSYGTLKNRFGSWNEVLKKAGLSLTRGHYKSHEYCESDEDFFADVRRVAKQLHKPFITTDDYDNYGKYARTYIKKIKQWNNVLKLSGLEQSPHRTGPTHQYSQEEVFEEIEKIWIKLGRQPKNNEFSVNNGCKMGTKPLQRLFGSWQNALKEFVNFINSDESFQKKTPENEQENLVFKNEIKEEIHHKTSRNVNLRLRFIVMQRDNFKCCKCGKSPAKDPSVELHVDHIFPWAKGGETVLENLQTLCSDCNLGKSDLIL